MFTDHGDVGVYTPSMTYQQDGELLWTELHRAVRLNDLARAKHLLEGGMNPNLPVQTTDGPVGDSHGHWDSWQQAQAYRDKRCLQLAAKMWNEGHDYSAMRALLESYGAF